MRSSELNNYRYHKPKIMETIVRNGDIMSPSVILNVLKSLVIDKAQTLAAEHVTKAIEDNLTEGQREMLDTVVEKMEDNNFKSFSEMFK